MKTFDQKVRIIDDETLQTIGVYGPDQVTVRSRFDKPVSIWNASITGLILIAFIAALIGLALQMHHHNEELLVENMMYQEIFESTQQNITIERLAGKYCTFKGKVPSEPDTLFKFICEAGAWYPEVIMAQVTQESNLFTSNVGRNAKNGFGMKKCGEGPNSRPNLQIPGVDYNGYGVYMNWYHSVLDRLLWDVWIFKGKKPATREEYLAKIGAIYAEDPNYIERISTIAKKWVDKVPVEDTVIAK